MHLAAYQIILITIYAFIAINDSLISNTLTQPAIAGMISGMIMGDLKTGLMVGGTLLSNYSQYAGKENIVNTRIDERLIHGQVAGIWSTSLSTQRIIVANDEAATDPLQKSSLRMAAPSSMRLSVLGVEAAAKNIQSGKYGKQRLFLLFKNPKDVLRFIEAQGPIKTVNVGNMSYKEGAREVTKSIQVLPEEEQIFETIASKGVTVTAQLVPNDPVVDFMKKLRG